MHAKGAVFFAQLWHQGRNTHSLAIGQQPESASDVPIDGSLFWSGMPVVPFEAPKPMTLADIEATQDDFVNAAVAARLGGCDGVELHGGNGCVATFGTCLTLSSDISLISSCTATVSFVCDPHIDLQST